MIVPLWHILDWVLKREVKGTNLLLSSSNLLYTSHIDAAVSVHSHIDICPEVQAHPPANTQQNIIGVGKSSFHVSHWARGMWRKTPYRKGSECSAMQGTVYRCWRNWLAYQIPSLERGKCCDFQWSKMHRGHHWLYIAPYTIYRERRRTQSRLKYWVALKGGIGRTILSLFALCISSLWRMG